MVPSFSGAYTAGGKPVAALPKSAMEYFGKEVISQMSLQIGRLNVYAAFRVSWLSPRGALSVKRSRVDARELKRKAKAARLLAADGWTLVAGTEKPPGESGFPVGIGRVS
jgi:hypothetical protein